MIKDMMIYVSGKDGVGWSIDKDRSHLQSSLKRLKIQQTRFFFNADIVHNIWWSNLIKLKHWPLFLSKNLLVTSSNFIDLENDKYALQKDFNKISKFAKAWVVPSSKQKRILEKFNYRTYYQPFYVSENYLKKSNVIKKAKAHLLKKHGIDKDYSSNRVLIGSFQRDSTANNLSIPKWQKNPKAIIDILKECPKDKYLLILAGPRRHYILKECKKYNIPYHYIGTESLEDDIHINSLSENIIQELYSLIDLYLVTSVSEGGPKAIMEATLTKTFIYSTDVGLAKDFIEDENVFTDENNYKKAVYNFVQHFSTSKESINQTIEKQFKRSYQLLNYDAMDKRLADIYKDILKR